MNRTWLGLWLLAGACAAPTGPASPAPAAAPLLGAADGSDVADRSCAVTLRSVRPATESDGRPSITCVDGLCWRAFEATVDVSDGALADGGLPEVLYRNPDGGDWHAATVATPTTAGGGFSTFAVRLDVGGVRDGLSATGLSRSRLELVAYLRAPSGSRVFDHNERPGDLENLLLNGPGFAFDADPGVCPGAAPPAPDAVARFDADFTHALEGSLTPGGTLAIDYDPARLPQCWGDTYVGRRAWDTLAWVRALPSGETLPYRSVVACDDAACASPTSQRAVFDVPTGAEAVEVWFSTSGRSCGVHYDSAYGENYRFEAPRPVGWLGGFVSKISRAGGAPCEGPEASALTTGAGYGTWARQRAVTSHVCFRAWSEGVTDFDNPRLGEQLDVSLVCLWDGEREPRRHGASFDAYVGNDTRYRVDLRGLDPFAPYRCPEVPTRIDGMYEVASAVCGVEANGASWGPAGEGGTLTLSFSDYPSNPWRAANCTP